MRAILGADQLGRDTDAISGTSHAAFEDRAHSEYFGNFADVLVFSLERERRGARDDLESGYVGQQIQDLLRQPVAEVLVIGVAAYIGKRQNGDGGVFLLGLHGVTLLQGSEQLGSARESLGRMLRQAA